MTWNWVLLALVIACVAMHLVGHAAGMHDRSPGMQPKAAGREQ